ncbi:DUF3106 domain-containing protein [Rhodoferax sp. GW822-FHT02A01]|uniref:DUF3106 domain-containing protein n=1 Tax=Rhodoferax sp. GW822-FHT02A01 TaxID=3141537 RepID=UPI00315C62D8
MRSKTISQFFMHFREKYTLNSCKWSQLAIATCGMLLALIGTSLHAQTTATGSVATTLKVAPTVNAPPTWESLDKNQRIALAPLEKSWPGLSEGQKRKWLAIVKTYASLGTQEQEKMHSRMVEWAALSPRDRELARLNFAHSKVINQSDRAANWEAYQALSPSERQKLAEGAKIKPVGAAVAVKPVEHEKLTPVPVTRHTPEQERAAVAAQRPLNRNTLLPEPLPRPRDSATATEANSPSKP